MLSQFLFEFGTLFAIINPYGLSFVFLNRTMNLSETETRGAARFQTAGAVHAALIASPAPGRSPSTLLFQHCCDRSGT